MTISQSCALPDISPSLRRESSSLNSWPRYESRLLPMRRAAAAGRSTRAPSSGSSKGESRKALGPQAPATSRSSQRRSNDAVAVSDSAAYAPARCGAGLLLTPVLPGQSAASVTGFWRPASVTGFGNQHPRSEQSAVSIWCPDALAACQELAGQRNESAENS